jgi:branched-chain amino acid transport system permease protein
MAMSKSAIYLFPILGAVVLAFSPYFFSNYIISVLLFILIHLVLAQSYDLMGGFMGYVNLGHYTFFGIGAYVFSIFLVRHFSVATSLAMAAFANAAFAAMISYPLFRLRGDYFAFATLAMIVLMEIMAFNLRSITGGPDGISLPPGYTLFKAFYVSLGVALVSFFANYHILKSKFGMALQSIREDEEVAEVMGIRVFGYKLATLVISASFAGIAGGIWAWFLTYIDPPTVFGLNVALVPIAMVFFGGTGKLAGPVVGVVILGILEQVLWIKIQHLHLAIYGSILIAVGIFMPGGIVRSRIFRRRPVPVKIKR